MGDEAIAMALLLGEEGEGGGLVAFALYAVLAR